MVVFTIVAGLVFRDELPAFLTGFNVSTALSGAFLTWCREK
jgi:hypothetical protein